MDEVEEICDHVTILRSGSVAFHGSLDELRALAPDPGHALTTTDDERALAMAHSALEVRVERAAGEGSTVTGSTHHVSAYVGGLVRAGIDLRGFTATRTPLQQLFFMLTDTDDGPDPVLGAAG